MATSRVVIVNGTDDDAVCKVSGGGGAGAPGSMAEHAMWTLPKRKRFTFSIEIGNRTVTPKVMNLKLTKNKNGYQLAVENGKHKSESTTPEP